MDCHGMQEERWAIEEPWLMLLPSKEGKLIQGLLRVCNGIETGRLPDSKEKPIGEGQECEQPISMSVDGGVGLG